MTKEVSRRQLLKGAALAGGGALSLVAADLLATRAGAESGTGLASDGSYKPKPLPFDPSRLPGLSERLLVSHHEKNYGGAVKRLNDVESRLRGLPEDAPPYLTGALKREQVRSMNSMLLHELYFANLGGGGGEPSGKVAAAMNGDFGSQAAWQEDFQNTGRSLSGGSGWVVLAYLPRDHRIANIWSSDHLVNAAWSTPLLVMDMYEHSYAMDYGADAGKYVAAFFKNIDWEEVERRAARVL